MLNRKVEEDLVWYSDVKRLSDEELLLVMERVQEELSKLQKNSKIYIASNNGK